MLTHTLLPFMLAAVALAQPDPDVPRPTPSPNANPTDTANPRLIGKRFPYNQLPLKADTGDGPRGIQVGFNQCNSTTESQTSMCQTLIANSIEDFCLFIPPTLLEVGSAEAGMVSACTKKGHGGRLIPQGALKGVQVLNAPSYMAIVGRIDQTLLNIPAGDGGGELDSGGQDGRGNPLGALAYSAARGANPPEQVVVWHEFIGGDMFCTKFCWNDKPNASNMCEHRYDTFGCGAVIAANYERLDGVFETCDSDDQIPPRPNTVLPLPATSNCRPVQSAAIYTDGPSVSGGGSTSTPAPTATGSSSSSGTPRPGSPGTTTTSGGSKPSDSSTPGGSAARLGGSSVVAFVGLVAGLAGWAIVV